MTKKQQTILLAVIGGVAVIAIAVIAVAVWAFTSMVNNAEMDEASATRQMQEVRARFANVTPVLDLRPDGLTLSRRPPDTAPSGELRTLHVLRWNGHEEQLTRVDIPFWILRMKEGPIDVMYEADQATSGLKLRTSSSVRVSDIERFGSTLLVDGALPDGGRLLIWSE